MRLPRLPEPPPLPAWARRVLQQLRWRGERRERLLFSLLNSVALHLLLLLFVIHVGLPSSSGSGDREAPATLFLLERVPDAGPALDDAATQEFEEELDDPQDEQDGPEAEQDDLEEELEDEPDDPQDEHDRLWMLFVRPDESAAAFFREDSEIISTADMSTELEQRAPATVLRDQEPAQEGDSSSPNPVRQPAGSASAQAGPAGRAASTGADEPSVADGGSELEVPEARDGEISLARFESVGDMVDFLIESGRNWPAIRGQRAQDDLGAAASSSRARQGPPGGGAGSADDIQSGSDASYQAPDAALLGEEMAVPDQRQTVDMGTLVNAREHPYGELLLALDDELRSRWHIPLEVKASGLVGTTVVELVVHRSGRVTGVRVVKQSGSPLLDRLAREAVPRRLSGAWRRLPPEGLTIRYHFRYYDYPGGQG